MQPPSLSYISGQHKGMLAESYATEDMKKHVNDLFNVIKEAGNKRLQAIEFIGSAYRIIPSNKFTKAQYTETIKNRYEYELAVLEITDDNAVARQTANKVLWLLTKYESKDLLIVLESALRLKDKLVIEISKMGRSKMKG